MLRSITQLHQRRPCFSVSSRMFQGTTAGAAPACTESLLYLSISKTLLYVSNLQERARHVTPALKPTNSYTDRKGEASHCHDGALWRRGPCTAPHHDYKAGIRENTTPLLISPNKTQSSRVQDQKGHWR